MRKFLFAIAFALPMIASAQFFQLKATGFVSTENPDKDFIVVEAEGSQQELFDKAKTAATAMWGAAKEVLSYNEPDIIVINGMGAGMVSFSIMGITTNFDVPYRVQLQFKDGRVRIDAPKIEKGINSLNKGDVYFGSGGQSYVFKKDGSVRREKMKEQAEEYINGLIAELIDKIKNGTSQEDW